MKKLLTIILIFLFVLSAITLTACDNNENDVYDIYVSTPPTKTIYYAGEKLDISGCVITVKTRSRNDYTVDVTPQMVSGFSSALGNHTLTITYTSGKSVFTTTQVITVSTRKAVSAKIVRQPDNATFIEGQKIDLTGFMAEVTFSDGSVQERPYTAFTLSATVAEMGLDEVTLKLDAVTLKVGIQVIGKQIVGLKVTRLPDKIEYVEGELFDPEGLEVCYLYNDGDVGASADYEIIDEFVPLVATQTTVKVKERFSEDLIVEVPVKVTVRSIKSIKINASNTRKYYVKDSIPDFSDVTAVIEFNDGATTEVGFDALSFDLDPTEPLTVGEKTVKVFYKYATESNLYDSFTIIVSETKEAVAIIVRIDDNFIDEYQDGETVSLLGLTVYIEYNDGERVQAIYANEDKQIEGFSYTQIADVNAQYIEFKFGSLIERVDITVNAIEE